MTLEEQLRTPTLEQQLRTAEQERDLWYAMMKRVQSDHRAGQDVHNWFQARAQEAENMVTLLRAKIDDPATRRKLLFALETIVALGRGAEQLDGLGTKMVQIAQAALVKDRE